jgi:hypothetical protein
MLRNLFRFVAAVSFLLLLATLVLWVRGRWRMDHFWLIHGDEGSELVRSADGRITFRHTRPNSRSRITLPQRVSHWSCRTGSQLPPRPSPLHWQWRFITYEGIPEATPQEIRTAHATISASEALRRDLRVSPAEWTGAQDWQFRSPVGFTPQRVQRQVQIIQAKAAMDRAQTVLDGSSYSEWTVPAWLVAGATAILPMLWLDGMRRRRRMLREGRCPGCGYDLRASGDRCPECGRSIGPARDKPAEPALDAGRNSLPFAEETAQPTPHPPV